MLFAHKLSDSVKEDLTVSVLISDATEQQELDRFRKTLSETPFIKSIQYISKEKALQEQIEAMGNDPSEFLGANPFTASLELQMKSEYSNSDSLMWISTFLKQLPCVEDVIYQKELVDAINKNIHRLSYLLLAVAALLLLISFALINNTVRLSLHAGRFVIRTMKLAGASRGFIRQPFMKRSFSLGFLSAIFANGILYGGIHVVVRYDAGLTAYIDNTMLVCVGGAVLLLGLSLTLLCTYFSVNKYLRMKACDVY